MVYHTRAKTKGAKYGTRALGVTLPAAILQQAAKYMSAPKKKKTISSKPSINQKRGLNATRVPPSDPKIVRTKKPSKKKKQLVKLIKDVAHVERQVVGTATYQDTFTLEPTDKLVAVSGGYNQNRQVVWDDTVDTGSGSGPALTLATPQFISEMTAVAFNGKTASQAEFREGVSYAGQFQREAVISVPYMSCQMQIKNLLLGQGELEIYTFRARIDNKNNLVGAFWEANYTNTSVIEFGTTGNIPGGTDRITRWGATPMEAEGFKENWVQVGKSSFKMKTGDVVNFYDKVPPFIYKANDAYDPAVPGILDWYARGLSRAYLFIWKPSLCSTNPGHVANHSVAVNPQVNSGLKISRAIKMKIVPPAETPVANRNNVRVVCNYMEVDGGVVTNPFDNLGATFYRDTIA